MRSCLFCSSASFVGLSCLAKSETKTGACFRSVAGAATAAGLGSVCTSGLRDPCFEQAAAKTTRRTTRVSFMRVTSPMSFANTRPIKNSAAQKKRGRPCLPGRPLCPPVQPFGGTNRLQDFTPTRSTKPGRLDADGLTTSGSGGSSTEPLQTPPVPPDSCSAPLYLPSPVQCQL